MTYTRLLESKQTKRERLTNALDQIPFSPDPYVLNGTCYEFYQLKRVAVMVHRFHRPYLDMAAPGLFHAEQNSLTIPTVDQQQRILSLSSCLLIFYRAPDGQLFAYGPRANKGKLLPHRHQRFMFVPVDEMALKPYLARRTALYQALYGQDDTSIEPLSALPTSLAQWVQHNLTQLSTWTPEQQHRAVQALTNALPVEKKHA